ncbi:MULTISPECIES: CPCC family cysteine-rich protein [Bacillus]|uniref:CPCC family cysteine-rich protein n=1 Tax=Bacillus TaxID=1386 RepID=UPI00273F3A49|nr:CPCC family cysteine-rich protein [Bacillus sp. MMSF_3328]
MNKNTCPCCGYKTLDSEGDYDICEICYWEDDPFQKENELETGANKVTLIEAQKNFIRYGACELGFVKNVREPNSQDKRDSNWKHLFTQGGIT